MSHLGFPEMHKILSPRAKGVAKIEHYKITKLDVLRELMHGGPCREGTVAILRVVGATTKLTWIGTALRARQSFR